MRFRETYILFVAAALAWASLTTIWNGSAYGESSGASQNLNFEDKLVEGMNKKPYDSLSQISEKDQNRGGAHLYWKRSNFQPEAQGILRELRYVQ